MVVTSQQIAELQMQILQLGTSTRAKQKNNICLYTWNESAFCLRWTGRLPVYTGLAETHAWVHMILEMSMSETQRLSCL